MRKLDEFAGAPEINITDRPGRNQAAASSAVIIKSKPSISSHHFRGAWILFADGSIQFVSDTTDPTTLKALLTQSPAE